MERILRNLPALIPSIIFCFRSLPFKQAIKLPILIFKPHDMLLKGKIVIDSDRLYTGMIRLGYCKPNLPYPNNGIKIYNLGKIIFKGRCLIGCDSYIIVEESGSVIFGDDFRSNASLKITSKIGIKINPHVRIGYNVNMMDTNHHKLYDMDKGCFLDAYGKIEIGSYNWISTNSVVLHSVVTPERCLFGLGTILTKSSKFESYCLHGGSPLKILRRNVFRDFENDSIENYE